MKTQTRFALGTVYLVISFALVLGLFYYNNRVADRLAEEQSQILKLSSNWHQLQSDTERLLIEKIGSVGDLRRMQLEWEAAYAGLEEALARQLSSPILKSLGEPVTENLGELEFCWLQPHRALENIRFSLNGYVGVASDPAGRRLLTRLDERPPQRTPQEHFYLSQLEREISKFLLIEDAFVHVLDTSSDAVSAEIAGRKSRNAALAFIVSIALVGVGVFLNNLVRVEMQRLNEELEQRVTERTAEIREREMTEAALARSEEKYRTIIEGMDEGYFETDLDGHLVFFNTALCRITGYERSELGLLDRSVYVPAATQRKLRRAFYRVYLRRETVIAPACEMVRKDGTRVVLEIAISLIKDRPRFRGLARDITDRQRAEQHRRAFEEQLLQAHRLESLGTLAGGIAHDFNNLLMAIEGNAGLVQMRLDTTAPDHEQLDNIHHLVESGADLTRQLLGFARSGKYEAKRIILSEVAAQSAQMFARTRKEIHIHAAYQDELWPVEVDRSQIEQVLLSLLVNAADAMPRGGDIHLTTENVTLDQSFTSPFSAKPGRYVRLVVSDAGVGMDEQTRRRIFEPFFTTKAMGRGTGLGLAAAYGIIKNHNGFIQVRSALGHGADFAVYLPASEKPAETSMTFTPVVVGGKETILLVDDEAPVRNVCGQMLRRMGYSTWLAEDGAEALRLLEEHKVHIDLVVLDMIMPGMSCEELFDRIKRLKPEVRVLLSSGYSIDGQASRILEQGCDGFIQKPFGSSRLSEKIQEVLGRRPPAQPRA